MKRHAFMVAALLVAGAAGQPALASDLFGSRDSMEKQHAVAVDLDYDFAMTASQVAEVVASGELEEVVPNGDFEFSGVSFPYAQPEVRAFIERLASEYHVATGLLLVVTSLTRPISEQPSNASPLSVHPAGMAVDLRIPSKRSARSWLSQRLLAFENDGVLDVTLERKPAHLHVAVYPTAFDSYTAREDSLIAQRNAHHAVRVVVKEVVPAPVAVTSHASANWLFAALTGGMLLSFVVAFSRKSAKAFAQLRIRRR
jgi:uncharacterized protein DUF5715